MHMLLHLILDTDLWNVIGQVWTVEMNHKYNTVLMES